MTGPLAQALLSSSVGDIRMYMGRRSTSCTLAFVLLLSSVAFLCPDVYSFASFTHRSSLAGNAPDRDPCRDVVDNTPHSPCYRALHDRVFQPATISGPLGGQRAMFAAFDLWIPSVPLFAAQLPTSTSKAPPRLALTVLFPVLRI